MTEIICCQCGRTYWTGGDRTCPSGMVPGRPCGHVACEGCLVKEAR